MGHEIGRQQLYELVWSEPMSRLAKKFGVSDVALAKACRRGDIPTPGLGYWAKVQHGQAVERKPLPPKKLGTPDTISITPLPIRTDPQLPSDLKEQLAKEALPENAITVSRTLSNAHPLVRDWIMRAQTAMSKTERRRLRILSTLFKELEKRGHALVPDPYYRGNFAVKVGEETVKFWLKERHKQSRVEPTPEERRYSLGQKWRPVLEPTSELVFTIQAWLDSGMRKQWSDGKRKPLEKQLNGIIMGLVLAAACLRRQRVERKERERQRREDERKRWELQEAKRAKERQLQTLMQDVNAWQQAALIRQFVQAAKIAAQSGQRTFDPTLLELWASRALALANKLDPLTSAEQLVVNGTQTEAVTT